MAGIELTFELNIVTFTELLEAVRTSLRAKVTALAEDNWMYEAEDEPTAR